MLCQGFSFTWLFLCFFFLVLVSYSLYFDFFFKNSFSKILRMVSEISRENIIMIILFNDIGCFFCSNFFVIFGAFLP